MLLKSRNGIKCDLCGQEKTDEFTYYSYDCQKVEVNINIALASKVENSFVSYDVCEECHNEIIKKVVENNKL